MLETLPSLRRVPSHEVRATLEDLGLGPEDAGRMIAAETRAIEKCAELVFEAYQKREERTRDGLQALRASIRQRASLPAGQVVGTGGELALIDELLGALGEGQ